MRGLLATLLVVALAASLVPSASARGGAPLDANLNTLWAQYTNEPECCEMWMGTLKSDPDFSGSGRFGFTATLPTGASVWEIPLTPALSVPVALDDTKTIDVTVFIDNTQGGGQVDVSTSLAVGGTVVATGAAKAVTIAAGFEELTWQLDPQVAVLDPANGNLVWTITASGVSPLGTYVSFSDDASGHSNVKLPIVGMSVPPGSIYEVLTGEIAEVSESISEVTTQTFVYNWTTTLSAPQVQFDATVGEGTIDLRIMDGANQTAYAKGMDATGSDTATPSATAGDWQIVVTLTDFQGSFAITVGPLPGEEIPEPEVTEEDPTQPDEGGGDRSVPDRNNDDGDSGGDDAVDADADAKGTPGFEAALLLAGLALVAIRARRLA